VDIAFQIVQYERGYRVCTPAAGGCGFRRRGSSASFSVQREAGVFEQFTNRFDLVIDRMYEQEMEIAMKAARAAGDLALRHFAADTAAEEKDDLSPVTAADRECEALISGVLSGNFPNDGIVGEEGAFAASRSGRRWLIDPIDGTRDFVRRTPFWSVQIALQVESQVVMGIIYLPCLNEMTHAALGSGCHWNGARTKISTICALEKAVLTVSGFSAVWDSWPPEAVRDLTRRCWTVRAHGGCYDIVMLMRGKVDIWLSGSGMQWDYAAARILARESGATFLTSDGADRIDAGNCLICGPRLETELRRVLQIGRGTAA
jgi:histidinol-phosphatase